MSTETKEKKAETVEVMKVTTEEITFRILGTTPFVCNAMSQKVLRMLVAPPPPTRGRERESRVKHDVLDEYRRSAYRAREADAPTRIIFPVSAFKRAMATAALEMPGITKSSIARLCWATGQYADLYGIPQIYMAVVRSADIKRTPDVRTRAIIPEWATEITISFVTPNLRQKPVVNLMASAGIFIGVGDGRPEKGALNFGQFEIVGEHNEGQWERIMATGGREAQDAAFANPTSYDQETEELLSWYMAEMKDRGFSVAEYGDDPVEELLAEVAEGSEVPV